LEFISVSNISKEYKVEIREEGMINRLKSLIFPKYTTKRAVTDISFTIDRGEIVGYLGPNGAGKSTTIKMLTGILYPTEGEVRVNGLIPYKERKKYSSQIGVVFGQRSQLWWDLPAIDSLELYKDIYNVSSKDYKTKIDMYNNIFDFHEFCNIPVRQLSLGQRMRVEIAASLIHSPDILFLDEPTIGLDIIVKNKMREFFKELNRLEKTTILLTTHDITDVEKICNRIIIINNGKKAFDGSTQSFKSLYDEDNEILVTLKSGNTNFNIPKVVLKHREGKKIWLNVNKNISIQDVLQEIITKYEISDIQVKGADLESLLSKVYQMNKEENNCEKIL